MYRNTHHSAHSVARLACMLLLCSVIMLGGMQGQARAAEVHAAAPVTVMKKPHLVAFMSEALQQRLSEAQPLEITLFGEYPEVIYQHQEVFVPEISIHRVDEESGRFEADAVLRTVDSAEQLGQRFTISGRFVSLVEVPVLSQRLLPDEVITESHISWQLVSSALLRDDTIYQPSRLMGLSPKRPMAAGRPIRLGDVEKPDVVRKHDLVTMIYRTPHLEIKTVGVAMSHGAEGQLIGVRNSSSGKTVKGTVMAPGVVVMVPVHHLSQLAAVHH